MPTASEYGQFRRLVGDYSTEVIDDGDIDAYLDDATRELTSDFVDVNGLPAPVTDIDTLVVQYHPEVIYFAAISWWWNYAADQTDQATTTVGTASEDLSTRWTRAMEMIKQLREQYDKIQLLGTDITIGNLSRFSKITMTRLGGQSEESARDA